MLNWLYNAFTEEHEKVIQSQDYRSPPQKVVTRTFRMPRIRFMPQDEDDDNEELGRELAREKRRSKRMKRARNIGIIVGSLALISLVTNGILSGCISDVCWARYNDSEDYPVAVVKKYNGAKIRFKRAKRSNTWVSFEGREARYKEREAILAEMSRYHAWGDFCIEE